jgi:hypothetical protein
MIFLRKPRQPTPLDAGGAVRERRILLGPESAGGYPKNMTGQPEITYPPAPAGWFRAPITGRGRGF